jgi:hypothetical protein
LALGSRAQGCQMADFQTKNPNFVKFWRVKQRKMSVHFMSIWSILLPFGIFCGFYRHFVYFPPFGMLYQEKSGNPGKGDDVITLQPNYRNSKIIFFFETRFLG